MTSPVQLSPLDFYARHKCALFPLPAGSKIPGSASFWPSPDEPEKAASFKRHHSSDPAQWARWSAEHPGCNFGMVAFASRLLVIDIDTKIGRDEAWALWCSLAKEWQLPAVPMPHVASPSGGWHVLFSIPDDLDPATLRQPDAIKSHINVRCIGYVVAAGSHFEGRPYTLLSDAPPYPAPAALIEHCTRRPAPPRATATPPGSLDPKATATLLTWLNERGQFESYEDWVAVGMALRIEFGDAGFALWELTFDQSVSPDTAASKWESFSTEPDAHSVTLLSFLARAHKLGWKGSIGRSTQAMFGDVVANIAASAGASLPGAAAAGSLIGNTDPLIAELGQPILARFFDTTTDVPVTPEATNYPQLPKACEERFPTIFEDANRAITRIIAMAENPKIFRQARIAKVIGLLHGMHPLTCESLVDFIKEKGRYLSKIKEIEQFEDRIRQAQNSDRVDFYVGKDGKPDAAISDNVGIFLARSNHQTQFDEFKRKAEVADENGQFEQFDQDALDRLWMLAKSAVYNYHPAEKVFRTGVKVEARKSRCYDSLRDHVNELANKWDGQPRLDTWLSRTCGVADDSYHRAVGRNLIGAMVRRARHPGDKQDETVIFISPQQGTGKSTLCRILALQDDRFLGSFKFGQSQQNSLPLIAGKWVVELGELAGMSKTDFEEVKDFLSATEDQYVAKYEAEATINKRRCVFIGTSNVRQPLADPSGNRRFLPVHVIGEIDLNWLRQNVEQLIAEAAVRDENGESLSIPKEIWALTTAAQEAARTMSPVEETCYNWFDRDGSYYILSSDLMNAFRMSGLGANVRISAFMDKMGWRKAQVGPHRDRVWIKHTNNNTDDCMQLVPAQQTANGRVEMRVRPGGAAPACPVPLPPPVPLPR